MLGIRTAALVVVAMGAIIGCGGDDDDASPTPQQEPATGQDVAQTPCADLFGRPVSELVDGDQACVDEAGTLTAVMLGSYDCADGRRLYWNDLGWGWSDGVWTAHARPDGQLVPPDTDLDACNP